MPPTAACELLADPHDVVPLLGDLHHGNILDGGSRGWLARRADIVATEAHLDRDRLLRWVLALCGLSAAWYLADGIVPSADLAVAELALAEPER